MPSWFQGLILFFMTHKHQQSEHDRRSKRKWRKTERRSESWWGRQVWKKIDEEKNRHKSWGKYVEQRQEQHYISSRNVVIISLCLPLAFFILDAQPASLILAQPNRNLAPSHRNWHWKEKGKTCIEKRKEGSRTIHPLFTWSYCLCPGCRWAPGQGGPCRSSEGWSLYPSLQQRSQVPFESYE